MLALRPVSTACHFHPKWLNPHAVNPRPKAAYAEFTLNSIEQMAGRFFGDL